DDLLGDIPPPRGRDHRRPLPATLVLQGHRLPQAAPAFPPVGRRFRASAARVALDAHRRRHRPRTAGQRVAVRVGLAHAVTLKPPSLARGSSTSVVSRLAKPPIEQWMGSTAKPSPRRLSWSSGAVASSSLWVGSESVSMWQ